MGADDDHVVVIRCLHDLGDGLVHAGRDRRPRFAAGTYHVLSVSIAGEHLGPACLDLFRQEPAPISVLDLSESGVLVDLEVECVCGRSNRVEAPLQVRAHDARWSPGNQTRGEALHLPPSERGERDVELPDEAVLGVPFRLGVTNEEQRYHVLTPGGAAYAP